MHRGDRYLASLFLSASLMAPLGAQAFAAPQEDRDHERHEQEKPEHRVYDPVNRQYHNWNQGEEQTYRQWLDERHEGYRNYEQLNKDQQRAYWNWRHKHERHDEHDRH